MPAAEVLPGGSARGDGEFNLAQGWQTVRDSKEEDDADDAAICGAGPGDDAIESGAQAAASKGAAERGGHQPVHRNQAKSKCAQSHHSAGCSSEIGGEEEERQLAWGLSADSMQHADDEDGFAGVVPAEVGRFGGGGVDDAAKTPAAPYQAVCGNGQAAIQMRVVRVANQGGDDASAEDDQRQADEFLSPVVNALGKPHVQLQDEHTQRDDGKGVSNGVGHAEANAALPTALHGGDVGNGSQMVVVEAMAQTQ